METTSQGAIALLALSHSPVEHALYEALRAATCGDNTSCVGSLSLRQLLELTGLGSYTTLRRAAGIDPYPKEYQSHARGEGFVPALERVVSGYDLSRREAQVALCCAEGLTNAEIGDRLCITEQTVKFHMRHLFIKFGVRRRGELISRLLRHEDGAVGAGGGNGRGVSRGKAKDHEQREEEGRKEEGATDGDGRLPRPEDLLDDLRPVLAVGA